MDGRADVPLTPCYTRDPSAAAAAGANPSAVSFGVASAGAPPTAGLARSLFMVPRTTSAAGGGAPAPAVKPCAPLSKLPNAGVAKAGKASAKKKKAADGSSRRPKKRLAGRALAAAATEAPASSLVPPAADAHNVFDEMPTSCNDDTYMSTMGVGSNNSHWSQTDDVHLDDHEFEVDEDGEGIVDAPKGRSGNYSTEEDILLCNTWLQVSRDPAVGGDQSRDAYWNRMKEHFDLHNKSGIYRTERSLRSRWSTINKDCQNWASALKSVDTLNPSGTNDRDRLTIAQNLFHGEEKKTKKGKIKKGKPFTLAHCYEVLKDDEKWKPRESIDEESNKRKRAIDLDDDDEEASSDDGKRSPTPNSVAYSKPKRPSGGKTDAREKKKKRGDDDLKNAMEAIVKARKEANEARMMARTQDAAAEERRLAAEERRVAAEERKVALEEKKLSMEERSRLLEWEKYLFFTDTSTLDDKQNEYVNLAREEVLVQKRAMAMGGMGATMGGMGGMGGMATMGGMGGFGATMGGMGGFGATMGGMGGFGATMGGMSFASLMGGMGAPPGDLGGRMSSGVPPHIPSHDDANPFRAPHDDAARNNEEGEEDTSSDDDEESEEEEDED